MFFSSFFLGTFLHESLPYRVLAAGFLRRSQAGMRRTLRKRAR
jgi:hypothetical protein